MSIKIHWILRQYQLNVSFSQWSFSYRWLYPLLHQHFVAISLTLTVDGVWYRDQLMPEQNRKEDWRYFTIVGILISVTVSCDPLTVWIAADHWEVCHAEVSICEFLHSLVSFGLLWSVWCNGRTLWTLICALINTMILMWSVMKSSLSYCRQQVWSRRMDRHG